MPNIKIYTVDDKYIQFLRNNSKLNKVILDCKENFRIHERKYIGAVITKNSFDYFIPLSSPKNSDFFVDNKGNRQIRKSIVPIIRITDYDNNNNHLYLLGTLKLNNMIPVPNDVIKYYDFNSESDKKYKQLVKSEYDFIKKNQNLIVKNANIIYSQKINENEKSPNYIKNTVDFTYAENLCFDYCKANNLMQERCSPAQTIKKEKSNPILDYCKDKGNTVASEKSVNMEKEL